MAKNTQVIDQTIATLYARDLKDYGIDATVLDDEAKRRISKALATLDATVRKEKVSDTNYRLDRFRKFHKLPVEDKHEVVRLAKEKNIPIEDAYELKEKAA